MHKSYIAVIQAGGRGTRMRTLTEDSIPKPMLLMNGKPLIEWQIENIKSFGIKEFVVIVGYLGEKIKEYLENGERWNIHISYIEENEPLGSAGSLFDLKKIYPNRDFLLIFGDVIFNIEWNRMISFHERHSAIITLLVHPNAHPYDSDLVTLSEEERVCAIDSKQNQRDYWYDNLVNAGIYIFDYRALGNIVAASKKDLEQDVILPLIYEGKVYGYRTPEYVKDTGTPERFWQAVKEQKVGILCKKSLKNKQKCVFLDRDGTINKYEGLLYQNDKFELIAGVAGAIQRLNTSVYLVIVVTNQPVVARGLCSEEDVKEIHRKMQVKLGEEGAYLDDIVFCPHHPDKGYVEENSLYKMVCGCRKPDIGMIVFMAEKYNIDLTESYIVGDSTVDIQTGINAGMKTILVKTGQAGGDGKYEAQPDYIADNLEKAVEYILEV
ncbi:MAG: HAD-IIIA family hydrolase [Dorea sp.]|jgi:D,D-heptose 1,7-bisphosphate phosphatase|nr:HAD-IIIA family hydrolase [Dorea sp.]